MTTIDPRSRPPFRPKSFGFTGVAVLIALMFGIGFQEVRWRGGLSSFITSPVESPSQQLKLGEAAFKNGNVGVALSLFEHLAAKNDPTAEYWLAHMTELGMGVPKEIPKAIKLYAKAARQNSIPSQTKLGEIYMHGDLVAPDHAKAFDLLDKAAWHGDPQAAMLLGQMYRFGLGTTVDQVESYAWSEVAVVEGHTFAKVERDSAFSSMQPADRDKAAARSAILTASILNLSPVQKP